MLPTLIPTGTGTPSRRHRRRRRRLTRRRTRDRPIHPPHLKRSRRPIQKRPIPPMRPTIRPSSRRRRYLPIRRTHNLRIMQRRRKPRTIALCRMGQQLLPPKRHRLPPWLFYSREQVRIWRERRECGQCLRSILADRHHARIRELPPKARRRVSVVGNTIFRYGTQRLVCGLGKHGKMVGSIVRMSDTRILVKEPMGINLLEELHGLFGRERRIRGYSKLRLVLCLQRGGLCCLCCRLRSLVCGKRSTVVAAERRVDAHIDFGPN
jgi:hypothetical protein